MTISWPVLRGTSVYSSAATGEEAFSRVPVGRGAYALGLFGGTGREPQNLQQRRGEADGEGQVGPCLDSASGTCALSPQATWCWHSAGRCWPAWALHATRTMETSKCSPSAQLQCPGHICALGAGHEWAGGLQPGRDTGRDQPSQAGAGAAACEVRASWAGLRMGDMQTMA